MLIFFLMTFLLANTQETKKEIQKIFALLLPGQHEKTIQGFTLKGCPNYDSQWLQLALFKKTFPARYTFQKGCDIEGTFYPEINKKFEASLKIRNVGKFTEVKTSSVVKIIPRFEEQKLRLDLQLFESLLTSPQEKVVFEGTYAIESNMVDFEDITNLGGELHLIKINDKIINLKEKILIE